MVTGGSDKHNICRAVKPLITSADFCQFCLALLEGSVTSLPLQDADLASFGCRVDLNYLARLCCVEGGLLHLLMSSLSLNMIVRSAVLCQPVA